MRELVICFKEDGEWIKEIEESRQYFLSEAEELVQKVRTRLQKEKREMNPKAFTLSVDGSEILFTHVTWDQTKYPTLEKQIINTISQHEQWDDDVREGYVNKIREYAENERQLFNQNEFRLFAIRLEETLPTANLSIKQQKFLFDQVYTNLTTSFFSKMEEVIASLQGSFKDVLRTKAEGDYSWFDEEDNFKQFGQYILANYLSVPKTRLSSIQVQFDPYHKVQDYLFSTKIVDKGFELVMNLHQEINKRILDKWDEVLFSGFALRTDDMIKSLLLAPIIQEFFNKEKEQEEITSEEQEFLDKILSVEGKGDLLYEGNHLS